RAARRGLPHPHAEPGSRRGRTRGRAPRGRDRIHGRGPVPRTDQVCAARLGRAARRSRPGEHEGDTMSTTTTPTPPTAADIEEALRDVIDPELGINIVDLGLVYGLLVEPGNNVVIDMTLTSAACPL